MKVSILINTYNRRDALLRTLDGVFAQSYPAAEIEILVLDDAGSDDTAEIIADLKSRAAALGLAGFNFYRNQANMGIAFGRGFLTSRAAANSTALLYLDDDVIMEKTCLEQLCAALADTPGAGLAGPRIVYAAKPQKTAHCANFTGPWTGRYSELDAEKPTECDWLNSSCLLARREALPQGAAWAAEFYTAHEEVDFCLAVKKTGFKVLYLPGAAARHEIDEAVPVKRDRLYYLYRNKFLVIHRNYPPLRRISAALFTALAGLPLYLAQSILFYRGINRQELRLILRAVQDGLAGRGGRMQ